MKSNPIKEVLKEYPYGVFSTFMGIIALAIAGLVYIGAFDALLPIKEQSSGLFNFSTGLKHNKGKNIIDYMNMASIVFAILGLILAVLSRLKQEDKIGSGTGMIASCLPLIIHFYLLSLIIIFVIVVLVYWKDIICSIGEST